MLYFLFNKIIISYLVLFLGFLPNFNYISGERLGETNCSLPNDSNLNLDISASSTAVLGSDVNFWLLTKSADEKRPVASITKLMTALVFLDTQPNWQNNYTIQAEDIVSGGRINLFLGDTLNLKDLFYTALIASDNGAATALVRSTGLSQAEFIEKMNQKAEEINLFSTQFVDVTGLSDNNISTAKDIARLAKIALNNLEIETALKIPEYTFITEQGRKKVISSTSSSFLQTDAGEILALVGKTGYTDQAGYCFVAKYIDKQEKEVISVVLGVDNRFDRFTEANFLAKQVLLNCNW
jgi:serine-type D-Ala-D-Ala endopeptidase (penicillin-binding protein 7)